MGKEVQESFMWRCLQLARLGAGYVIPNPMVGAVLVHEGKIIGEGCHRVFGEPHAEVNCIQDALRTHPEKIAASVLYVSLEPCAHQGKTPPCADLILAHKIPRVVIACRDPFKEVDGRGIEKLRKAGVEVVTGVLEKEAIALNRAFFGFHQQKRPYITLKWAQSADGFIAGTGEERLLISNEYSNIKVHQWRSEHAAIMVGANTALKDNPLLDNRKWFGPAPKKIVFDPGLKVPADLKMFDTKDPVVVLNTGKDRVAGNILYLKADKKDLITSSLQQLYELKIQSILVEGGRKLLQLFIQAGLWDEARVITNRNLLVAEGLPAPRLVGGEKCGGESLLNDELLFFKNTHNSYIDAATGLL